MALDWLKGLKKKVFGNSVLDELGGIAGFVTGGPVGAGVGAAAGRAAHGALKGESFGDIAKGAIGTGVKAGGLAYGGQALLNGGGAAAAARMGSDEAILNAGRGGRSLLGGIRKLGADALPSILDWAKDNPEWVLAGASALQGARQDTRENAMVDEDRAHRSQIRDIVLRQLTERDLSGRGSRPNIAGITHDPGNPYDRRAA